MKRTLLLTGIAVILFACGHKKVAPAQVQVKEVSFEYSLLKGLEPEQGVCRRDPSDVIKVNETYYVWYTRTEKQYSGYDASVWYATSSDGENWTEKGEALARGKEGSWDAFSVFTPNILKAGQRYYLFYTGVKPTPGNPEGLFENNSETDITAIGLAVADSPDGPFTRLSDQSHLGNIGCFRRF